MRDDKRSRMIVVFLAVVSLMSSLLPSVNAFKVVDHSMCRDDVTMMDFISGRYGLNSPYTCKQRTSQFQLTDSQALLWVRGILDPSDVGAKIEFRFYDPSGRLFHSSGEGTISGSAGEVGWGMAIGITSSKVTIISTPGSVTETSARGSASEKPGEWRAEFTLDGRVVVSERFTIGDKVTLTVQIKPGKAGVPISIDGTPMSTDAAGRVQVKVSITDSHTVQVPSESSIGADARTVFVKWEDGSTSNPRTVTTHGDMTLAAEYKTRYLLTVNSPSGNPQGSGWYDEGSLAAFSVTAPWTIEGFMGLLGGKYVFERWSGDSTSATPSASVRMDGPKTVTAEWRADNTMPYTVIAAIGAAAVVIVALMVAMKRKKKQQS